ncbi:hypothetical protein HK097_001051 [Rhizophlyctis rosea]|uniref:WD40 repeat-like protein n=1 Tax=Rhizophlyctis rosea TaxID=64517 RepID=A0AAD5SGC1_9FUNG|nr:hypothetical protein HK097_001051 [Rhizophlyctis rosea]
MMERSPYSVYPPQPLPDFDLPPYLSNVRPQGSSSSAASFTPTSTVTNLKPIAISEPAAIARSRHVDSEHGLGDDVGHRQATPSIEREGLRERDVTFAKYDNASSLEHVTFAYGSVPRHLDSGPQRPDSGQNTSNRPQRHLSESQSSEESANSGRQHQRPIGLAKGTFVKLSSDDAPKPSLRKRTFVLLVIGITFLVFLIAGIALGIVLTRKSGNLETPSQPQPQNQTDTKDTSTTPRQVSKPYRSFEESGPVTAFAIAPDGSSVFTVSDSRRRDFTISQWDARADESVTTRGVIRSYSGGHNTTVTAIHMSLDGRWMFSGDASGRVFAWNITTSEKPIPINPTPLATLASVHSLQSTDKTLYISGADRTNTPFFQILNITDISLPTIPNPTQPTNTTLTFHYDLTPAPGSSRIYWSDGSGTLTYLSSSSPDPVTLQIPNASQNMIPGNSTTTHLSTTRDQVYISTPDLLISWNVYATPPTFFAARWDDSSAIRYIPGSLPPLPTTPQQHITQSLVSSDGQYILAAVEGSNEIRMWNYGPLTGNLYPVRNFTGHDGRITHMQMSPDGRYLYSGGEDGRVRMWKITESSTFTKNPVSGAGRVGNLLIIGWQRMGLLAVFCLVAFAM